MPVLQPFARFQQEHRPAATAELSSRGQAREYPPPMTTTSTAGSIDAHLLDSASATRPSMIGVEPLAASPQNCARSVEPSRAVVEDVPPEIARETRSK